MAAGRQPGHDHQGGKFELQRDTPSHNKCIVSPDCSAYVLFCADSAEGEVTWGGWHSVHDALMTNRWRKRKFWQEVKSDMR